MEEGACLKRMVEGNETQAVQMVHCFSNVAKCVANEGTERTEWIMKR